jgi:hypothetical protein
MRLATFIAAALLIAAPAFARPVTSLEKEASVWQAFKDRKARTFRGMFAYDYVGVYAAGRCGLACEVAKMQTTSLKSFRITNFSSRLIDPKDLLSTYSVDLTGTQGRKSISGRYWESSLWHRSSGKWRLIYHSEVKAP